MIHVDSHDSLTVMRLEHGKVNALDKELLAAMGERLEQIEKSPYGAVILTGSGAAFSAGVDLWRVLDEEEGYLDAFLPALTEALTRLFAMPRPVVAAINGHAIAGGCVLACACDYRIMADGTGRIGAPELKVGVPFPQIALDVLRCAAPPAVFSQLLYLGTTYNPQTARDLGLIHEVVSPKLLLERAGEVARQMAAIPADTFRITKRQVRQPILQHIERHAETGDREVARLWSAPEVHTAIRTYMETTVRRGRDK